MLVLTEILIFKFRNILFLAMSSTKQRIYELKFMKNICLLIWKLWSQCVKSLDSYVLKDFFFFWESVVFIYNRDQNLTSEAISPHERKKERKEMRNMDKYLETVGVPKKRE